ncbi:PilW family protein [Stutzerimonas nitrititolerans]|uniref:PilW family protein n=1 Tax=Stutzerimonas nitrititolerans TaxID=2482751 RepID=UPI0028AE292F|nr:type II secretion system protein [Stutzerimonas nitrititolerans]
MFLTPPSVGASLLAIDPFCSEKDRQRAGSYKRGRTERGFTLVELIMVIALAGIVAVMISTVMSRPLQGFVDQSRRAELTDLAAMALNRMVRDIRLAVPNSLVATDATQLHFVSISAAGRYRANQPDLEGPRQDPPACTQPSGKCVIEILSPIEPSSSTTEHWLIIYNTETLVNRPESSDGDVSVISPKAFTWQNGTLNADLSNFRFQYASAQHRFYLAKEVVGYRCEEGNLWRETYETLNVNGAPASSAKVVNSATCSFRYEPGTQARNGLVTLRLSLSKGGETVTLLQQVQIDNAP